MKASRPDRDGGATSRTGPAFVGSGGDEGHESLQDCLRKLVQVLPQVARGLRRSQHPSTAPGAKLTARHRAALSLLHQHGSLTVGQLATQLSLTLPTTSGIVADVEKVGFAVRSVDPADRRRTIVSLIPQQHEALGAWLDGATAPMVRALDRLSPEERTALLKAMTFLQAELNGEQR